MIHFRRSGTGPFLSLQIFRTIPISKPRPHLLPGWQGFAERVPEWPQLGAALGHGFGFS